MSLRRNSLELRDGIVKFVLSDLACHTRNVSPFYVFTRRPRRFGAATRKLRLGPGSEIVCQNVTIRHNSVLNR